MSSKQKIVVTRSLGPDVMPILQDRQDIELVVWPEDRACDRAWLLSNVKGATALVVMVSDKVDAEVLESAGNTLKAVSTMSVGYEHVDVKELAKRDILLGYTPDVLTEAVADVCIMLALMAGRNAPQITGVVNQGQVSAPPLKRRRSQLRQWPQYSWSPFLFCGRQLSAPNPSVSRTAGFIGFGRIAKSTLSRLIPFGFTSCLYYGRPGSTPTPSEDEQLASKLRLTSVKRVALGELAEKSDVVFILAPGGESTYHIVDEAFLRKMKSTSVLVNASRGSLVDSDALAKVLAEGGIWGAGLDVVEGEPNITQDHPLVKEPRCAILPHIGSATYETRVDMAKLAAENALAAVLGEPMPYLLPAAMDVDQPPLAPPNPEKPSTPAPRLSNPPSPVPRSKEPEASPKPGVEPVEPTAQEEPAAQTVDIPSISLPEPPSEDVKPQASRNPSPAPAAVDEPPIEKASLEAEEDAQSSERALNVTDALSYLDQVKLQFQDQPDVYNHFLDIMKEFKNEQIDTPGVITRVSNLFDGHPSLIQGFNTFLPQGYRIECGADALETRMITVTTPSGTIMQATNGRAGWLTTRDAAPTPPVEPIAIEPAVQYVQKIKQSCDAETYRQFLDILSRYHHTTSEGIDEVQSYPASANPRGNQNFTLQAEVSRQIATLFKDAPELANDFRVFMPGRDQHLLEGPPMPLQGLDSKGRRKLDVVAESLSHSNSSGLPQKRKRKAGDKDREREKDAMPLRSSGTSGPASKKLKHGNHDVVGYNPKHIVAQTSSPRPGASSLAQPTMIRAPVIPEETSFFDKVKRAIDNREVYNEFLKVVNLFTQDYIDMARLVQESRRYLSEDLHRQFKEILGWDNRKESDYIASERYSAITNFHKPSTTNVIEQQVPVESNERYSSYRPVSAQEANVPCSGRDEMCRLVLNDEWVSHPAWSSEDSGFIAHKKNIYEEALHRSEEERHEYDFHLEAITRTIAMLEPINNKIMAMSPEEKGGFKIKPNLGGNWKAIHTRVVKKIYGRDQGMDVIASMQDSPALAVPVVLQRLKQKEEEWKRAQREWNKVWREVDARNYAKSLDHQAITFKAADKKAITTKAFVSQIEAAREEQMAARASLIDPLFARTRPRHQLDFVLEDVPILQDALKLTFSFLDRTQAQVNFVERRRIENFLRSFVPLFFALEPVAFNAAFVAVGETAIDSEGSEGDAASHLEEVDLMSIGAGPSRGGRGGGSHRKGGLAASGGDLRKKLLKSEQAKSSRKTRANDASPADDDFRMTSLAITQNGRKLPRRHIFFTNTIFYVLIRLIQVLVARLTLFKELSAEIAEGQTTTVNNPMGLPVSKEYYYEVLLDSCERLFDNELETPAFEEQMRAAFGIKNAYKIFTIDKVISALIKQVQSVFADSKSQDLLELLKRERSLNAPTTQDQINSRRSTEKVLGPDENLFRVDWLSDSKTITIQLIGKDDSSFDDSEVLTGRWQSYIDSYVSADATSGVSQSKMKSPFLRRNIPASLRESQPSVASVDNLEIKVCIRTYRLFYVSKSEDFLWKYRSKDEMEACAVKLKASNALRRQWIEKSGSS
ncbi:hypothetical protein BKA70DRAFT_1385698 [Coprinopsis sp. MPI-PUGE-AT-0042]|nr:hypothetical protein BKA70DRAFT_1385698 [Coprinopsis sp. MPI-PUGE-AT-0042]